MTVILLPLLLYPILGIAMLQVAQFLGEKPTRILVVGSEMLQSESDDEARVALFQSDGWNPKLFGAETTSLAKVIRAPFSCSQVEVAAECLAGTSAANAESDSHWRGLIQQELQQRQADVLLWISVDTEDGREQDRSVAAGKTRVPKLQLFQNSASDHSRVATQRVEQILTQWYLLQQQSAVARSDGAAPASAAPFEYQANDLAPREQLNLQLWSKILPFILFLWTLTGAFYCAVDLCAGEKERGTLEALLVTPASRTQIVVGKLLTTMAFSMTSGMVNLLGTVATGWYVTKQLGAASDGMGWGVFGAPPLTALIWLMVGAVPISALFSAISLAVAAFARSTKEGQHYLMPVLMTCVPLLSLPMLPGLELDLGMSLLPIAGLMFWLRALIEGEYLTAARFLVPVLCVTAWCVYLAVTWAVTQFKQESVLFRPVERFSLVSWFSSLLQRREARPTLTHVAILMVVMVSLKLGLPLLVPSVIDWNTFAIQAMFVLVLAIGIPALVLSWRTTDSICETLRLKSTAYQNVVAAFLLAICFHPLILLFQQAVMELYPISVDAAQMSEMFNRILGDAPGMWAILLVMAVTPAICEELAFRGFILSGLIRWLKPLNAVAVTAVLFGAMHGLLQQSVVATFTGLFLGCLALRTGSLWPCIVYHATHNGLTLHFAFFNPETVAQSRLLSFLFEMQVDEQGQMVGLSYAAMPAAFMIVVGIWIWLNLRPVTGVSGINEKQLPVRTVVAGRNVSEATG